VKVERLFIRQKRDRFNELFGNFKNNGFKLAINFEWFW